MLAFSRDPKVPPIEPFCHLLFSRSIPFTYTEHFPFTSMGSCSPQKNSANICDFGTFIYKFTLHYRELQHQ